MSEMILSLCIFVIGYVAIKIAYSVWSHNQLDNEETHNELMKHIAATIHPVAEEKHDGVIYWFDEKSQQFLAQGSCYEDIVLILKQRFPKHVFVLSDSFMMIGPEFNSQPINHEEISKHIFKVNTQV